MKALKSLGKRMRNSRPAWPKVRLFQRQKKSNPKKLFKKKVKETYKENAINRYLEGNKASLLLSLAFTISCTVLMKEDLCFKLL